MVKKYTYKKTFLVEIETINKELDSEDIFELLRNNGFLRCNVTLITYSTYKKLIIIHKEFLNNRKLYYNMNIKNISG